MAHPTVLLAGLPPTLTHVFTTLFMALPTPLAPNPPPGPVLSSSCDQSEMQATHCIPIPVDMPKNARKLLDNVEWRRLQIAVERGYTEGGTWQI